MVMGPTEFMVASSLQPTTVVQPLTSTVDSRPPRSQEGTKRVRGWSPACFSPATQGAFTSREFKSSLVALSHAIGTGQRGGTGTGPQSHTGWAVEGS